MTTGLTAVAISSRLTLGLVFAVAATGKISGQGEYSAALREFGFSDKTVNRALSLGVPVCEGVLAAGLVSGVWAWQAAAGAAVLLAAFSLLVIRVLLRREQIICRCFGNLSNSRLGVWALARNAALLLLALIAILGSHSSSTSIWPPSNQIYVVLILTLSELTLIYMVEMAASLFTKPLPSFIETDVRRKPWKGGT